MWTRFLVPPPSRVARVKTSMDGSEVKSAGFYRTILSNGAGAAAQLRAGWGEIYSQYDAVLAANPDKNVPSDRLNLWARTRCWLQREGYTREFDKKCLKRFFVDPEGRFARWDFAVPCGMGKDTFPQKMQEYNIPMQNGRIRVTEYINDMDTCMAAADLVVCRSGASVLAELEALHSHSVPDRHRQSPVPQCQCPRQGWRGDCH